MKLTLSMVVVAVLAIIGALAATRGGSDDTAGGPTDRPTAGQQTEPGTSTGAPSTGGAPSDPPLVRDDSPRLSEGSEAVFVEFLDFECPSCAGVFGVLEEMRAEYGDRIGFVVRYVPLHANSMNSFRAAEAAGEQGRYEDMYVMLFERQTQWAGAEDDSFFFAYAEELGLDAEQFERDFSSDEVAQRIQQSVTDANELGVQGTPTFFLDGEEFSPETVQDLENAFRDAVE